PGEVRSALKHFICKTCGTPFAKSEQHRVGGGVAPAVLPHHRTYGSVYGGSVGTCQLLGPFEEADESKLSEFAVGDRLVHVAGAGIPPGTSAIRCGEPGPLPGQASAEQGSRTGPGAFPLSPQNGAQLSTHPL